MTRRRHHRGRSSDRHKPSGKWVTCNGCGKHGYDSRSAARAAARANHPDDGTLQAYSCRQNTGEQLWHYGHVPDDVRIGVYDKRDYLEAVARRNGR